MRYFDRGTKNTPNIWEIRQLFPNMSIPDGADLTELGYDIFNLTPPPEALPFHNVVEDAPTTNTQVWKQVAFTDDQLVEYIVDKIQERLDSFAQTRNYDDIKSLASYAGDSDAIFNTEGSYGKTVRSQTWRAAINYLDEVKAGTKPKPTNLDEVFAILPPLAWPE